MGDGSKDHQKILADLLRAKALFQQRSLVAYLGKMPDGSNKHQEKGEADG